jgi:4-amino-4-deoxy-L-arabinose transferase-like glycosyltransferase
MHFAAFQSVEKATGRWRDVLADPTRRERTLLITLALYVLLWAAYGTVSKNAQGLNPDMTEVVAWSRDLSLGYLKHPPFAAWVAWLWFSVFPIAEWSYYLLAMLMPAITLWIVWRMSADYLDVDKRIVGLALLTLVPFFNFHALKFNVNTVLMPLWAATTWFFLRSVRTRSTLWAALAGIAAAASMLGKYWSVFLLSGLALAALLDRRRLNYIRSSAPYVTAMTGFLALAPHLVWLTQHEFVPFSYAAAAHGEMPFTAIFSSVLGYLAGSLGYVAAPIVIVLIAAAPRLSTLADIIWPPDDDRRLAAAAFWGPLLLPTIGALATRTEITSLWSMPAFSLLPVVLLSSPAVLLRANHTLRIMVGAAALPLVMLLVSPVITMMAQRAGPPPASAQGRLLAAEVERLWRQATPQPLRFVGGNADLAYGVVTFAADRPRALPGMLQPSADELTQNGLVLVCFAENAGCGREATARSGEAKPAQTELVRNFAGIAGKPQRYTIVIVPPRP